MDKIRDVYIRFTSRIDQYLPIDLPEHMNMKPIPLQTPSEKDIQVIKKLGVELYECIMDMSCYIHDFRIEAQNHLLGDLFKRKVASREPTDSKFIAISTDNKDVQKIIDHFNVSDEEKQRWANAIARDSV